MKLLLPVLLLVISFRILAQVQTCPLNNSFVSGDLTHWAAYTGNNRNGNGPSAIKLTYDSLSPAPTGTLGTNTIYEYNLPDVSAIHVLTTASKDPWGGFSSIPNINGYQYTNSVLIGSTAITHSNASGVQGGYVRGIRYNIHVPPGPPTEPYTMTYAYAMVLENGTHNSNQQPLFSATLTGADGSVIQCASPKYFLPTSNTADNRGTGAILDTAMALQEGFKLSPILSPNPDPNNNSPNAPHLQDVWTKDWTEVTFDLSPYRGQQVTLTFETDNCVPGGHFAYSYVALRNVCDGLIISGPLVACEGGIMTYSIPALAGATYQWTIPPGWTIVSGSDSSILKVKAVAPGGKLMAHETNSCADLKDTIDISTVPPTIAGQVLSDAEVCTGMNSTLLNLNGKRGNVLGWLSSADGVNWNPVTVTTTQYSAQNLTATTIYRVLVQNGSSCEIDTSGGATILVDPRSVAGQINPSALDVCMFQDKDALLTLTGKTGNVLTWQSSTDNVNWSGIVPADTSSTYYLVNLPATTWFRTVVKSGVCPADTSAAAIVNVLPGAFPKAMTAPADTTICYGKTVILHAVIERGTSYAWNTTTALTNAGSGTVGATPDFLDATASPTTTTDYVLSILNAGCPNPLKDTFHVAVIPPIIVEAGNDTSIVINQPLQLHATANNSTVTFNWAPPTGLDNPNIADPVALFGGGIDSVRYVVTATTPAGCTGKDDILVKIFRTMPDIFVPNAFTPGGGSNNIFRPIPVGIAYLQFFRVYNRWGQLVYATSTSGSGWDGTLGGKPQMAGTYVWEVQGKTYTGKIIYHKGTMVLIR